MKKKIPTYPIWICHPCGEKHGNRTVGVATWHKNTCDICGAEASVTEPRDYGHLKDTWIKAAESRSGGQQNCKHCGSTEDFWWSRAEPMGYYCSNCGEGDESTTYPYVEAQGNIIAELSSRNDWVNKELAVVTEQRDEALSDLEFRRDLFKLQEQQLNDVRAERDDLIRYNEAFRKETLICADCDSISKEEYDQAIEQRDRLAEALERWPEIRKWLEMSKFISGYMQAEKEFFDQLSEALQSLTTNEQ